MRYKKLLLTIRSPRVGVHTFSLEVPVNEKGEVQIAIEVICALAARAGIKEGETFTYG